MAWFQKMSRHWRSRIAGNKASDLKFSGQYEKAAEAFAEQADIDLPENELIFADECRYSFDMWMKAGNAEKALEQGRRALSGYEKGDWLKGDNDYIDDLTYMVGELQKADHVDEADTLLTDINNYLVSIGEQRVEVALVGKQQNFPPACPSCGGTIGYHGTLKEISCPFCGAVVRSI